MPRFDDDAASDFDESDDASESDASAGQESESESDSDDFDEEDDDDDEVSGKKRKRAPAKPAAAKKAPVAKAPKVPKAPKAATAKATPVKKAPAKPTASKKSAAKAKDEDEADEPEEASRPSTVLRPPPPGGNTSSAAAAAVVASVQGTKITNEKQAESVILDYLNKSNRPYSAINVHDNLHGAIGKTIVPKLLDKLADSGTIKTKTYGKFKLYWPDQAQYGEVGQAEIDSYTTKSKELEVQLAEIQARKKALQARLNDLNSALSPAEVASQLTTTTAAIASMKERLERLTSSGIPLVTPEERMAVKSALDKYRKAWSLRKRMVMDVVDNMAEGLEKKPADLCETVGIETDEDSKVSIKDFV